jgi:hypothetical protein
VLLHLQVAIANYYIIHRKHPDLTQIDMFMHTCSYAGIEPVTIATSTQSTAPTVFKIKSISTLARKAAVTASIFIRPPEHDSSSHLSQISNFTEHI